MPSWLVSFVVHLVLILILAVVPLRQVARGPLTLLLGEAEPVGIGEFELTPATTDTADDTSLEDAEALPAIEPITTASLLEMDLSKVLPEPSLTHVENRPTPALDNLPFGLAQGLTGRTGSNKQALLERFGGTAATEDAVALGLAWLIDQQKSDGSWSLKGPYSAGGANENKTAATAMAINALLGAGYTSRAGGKYSDEITMGLKYLLKKQDKDGFFANREPSRQQMYAQALASIAVLEAYGMTGDSELRRAAEAAVRFAEWSQSKLRGWRYEPRHDADLSVTGWYVMVLETAKMAGLGVDEEVLQSVHQFLDSISHEGGSQYSYNNFEPASLSMTAEGLLCRILLGWPKSEPALLQAIETDLLPSAPSESDDVMSVYYWYYATQVLHHVGGEAWMQWNDAMKQVLPATQEKDGPEKGSWDPSRDIYGSAGGRLYTTCLHLYCLEVYYRHLSIYDTH